MMTLLLLAPEKSALKGFLGALHPGVIHFPIALLSAALLLELWQVLRKRREPAPGTLALSFLAAAAAIPACVFGFMLADYEGAEGTTLQRHQWVGVAAAVVSVV